MAEFGWVAFLFIFVLLVNFYAGFFFSFFGSLVGLFDLFCLVNF